MNKNPNSNIYDFENILKLIEDAKNRAFAHANSELVLLYFNVGKVVSENVTAGNWGENTVQELAIFIQSKMTALSGFSRRGLYPMKQFFETYSNTQIVSPVLTQLQSAENKQLKKVPEFGTQNDDKLTDFITKKLLTNISWTKATVVNCKEIIALFVTTIKTTKSNLKK